MHSTGGTTLKLKDAAATEVKNEKNTVAYPTLSTQPASASDVQKVVETKPVIKPLFPSTKATSAAVAKPSTGSTVDGNGDSAGSKNG